LSCCDGLNGSEVPGESFLCTVYESAMHVNRHQSREAVLGEQPGLLGQTWATEWVQTMRSEGRRVAGGWPGTIPEARMRAQERSATPSTISRPRRTTLTNTMRVSTTTLEPRITSLATTSTIGFSSRLFTTPRTCKATVPTSIPAIRTLCWPKPTPSPTTC